VQSAEIELSLSLPPSLPPPPCLPRSLPFPLHSSPHGGWRTCSNGQSLAYPPPSLLLGLAPIWLCCSGLVPAAATISSNEATMASFIAGGCGWSRRAGVRCRWNDGTTLGARRDTDARPATCIHRRKSVMCNDVHTNEVHTLLQSPLQSDFCPVNILGR
jgi:hypothetical protein